jgi:hypothetical protein
LLSEFTYIATSAAREAVRGCSVAKEAARGCSVASEAARGRT